MSLNQILNNNSNSSILTPKSRATGEISKSMIITQKTTNTSNPNNNKEYFSAQAGNIESRVPYHQMTRVVNVVGGSQQARSATADGRAVESIPLRKSYIMEQRPQILIQQGGTQYLQQGQTDGTVYYQAPIQLIHQQQIPTATSGSYIIENPVIFETVKKQVPTQTLVTVAGGISTMDDRIQMLNAEIEKYKLVLKEKASELESWQMKCSHLETHLLEMKGGTYKSAEYEQKLQLLLMENQKLNGMVLEKEKELEAWRIRYSQIEIKLTEIRIVENRARELEQRFTLIVQELDQWKQRCGELERDRQMQENVKRGVQQDRVLYEQELKNLRDMLEAKSREVEEWRRQYITLESRLTSSKDSEGRIVLLAAEIERMHLVLKQRNEEMELWRQKVLQLESIISELKTKDIKIYEYENRINLLTQDLERYQNLARMKGEEHENLKRNVNKLELELKDRASYEAEIQNLRGLLELRAREIEEWKSRYGRLEINITEYKAKESRYSEYENKIGLLTTELERLNSVLKSKLDEIETWRRNYAQLEIRLRDSGGLEIEINNLRQLLELRNKEIDEWRSRYSKLEITITDLRSGQSRLSEYETKIALLSQELERLQMILRQKGEDYDNLMKSYTNLELSFKQRDSLSVEITNLKQILELKNREIDEWKSRYGKLEITISDLRSGQGKLIEYENRITMLSSELERVNNILRDRLQEIENWKSRYSKLEINMTELRGGQSKLIEYENRIALLSQELERCNTLLRQKNEEQEGLKRSYGRIELSLKEKSGLESELANLRQMLDMRGREIEEWRGKCMRLEVTVTELRGGQSKIGEYETRIAMLSTEIERINNLLREKHQEIEDLKSKNSKSELYVLELRGYQSKISDYENRIALMAQELERTNTLLRQRSDEHETLKRNAGRMELSLRDKTSLEGEIANLRRELDDTRLRYSKLEISYNEVRGGSQTRLQEYENRITLLSTEVDRLNKLVASKTDEIEGWRSRYSQYELSMRDKLNAEADLQRMRELLNMKQSEVDDWRAKYSTLELRIQELRSGEYRISEFQNKLSLLSTEVERLNEVLRTKVEEIEQWKVRYSRLERDMYENRNSNEKIKVLDIEIDRLNLIIREKEKDIAEMRSKFVENANWSKLLLDHQAKMVLLMVEVESLRTRFLEKVDEIENIKRSSVAYAIYGK